MRLQMGIGASFSQEVSGTGRLPVVIGLALIKTNSPEVLKALANIS
jgi:hypothetical protein